MSTPSSRRSYQCYHCNHSFHLTATTTPTLSFRCPHCHHRHLLPHHTPIPQPPPPPPPPPIPIPSNSHLIYISSDSETDADSDTDPDSDTDSFFDFTSTYNIQQTPTLKTFIDSLPDVSSIENGSSCPICIDELTSSNTLNDSNDTVVINVTQLPCQHYFHKDCVVEWLNRCNTCPLCRYKLPKEEPRTASVSVGPSITVIEEQASGYTDDDDEEVGGLSYLGSGSSGNGGGRVYLRPPPRMMGMDMYRRRRRVVVVSPSSSSSSSISSNVEDVQEEGIDAMRDADGDILMVDA